MKTMTTPKTTTEKQLGYTLRKTAYIETETMEFCRKNCIIYNKSDTFQRLAERIIHAILSDDKYAFEIPKYVYEQLGCKPTGWDKNYKNYYRYNENEKVYVVNDKNTFETFKIYRMVKNEMTINDIREKYRNIVKEFLIPEIDEYKKLYKQSERKEIEYIVGKMLLSPFSHDYMPSFVKAERERLRCEYRGISSYTVSSKLLSYNDKIRITKAANPKETDETNSKYDERIKALVAAGCWQKYV